MLPKRKKEEAQRAKKRKEKKKKTLNRMSRNQKADSREGDVIKEVYPLE